MRSEWAAKVFGDREDPRKRLHPYSVERCRRVGNRPSRRSSGQETFSPRLAKPTTLRSYVSSMSSGGLNRGSR